MSAGDLLKLAEEPDLLRAITRKQAGFTALFSAIPLIVVAIPSYSCPDSAPVWVVRTSPACVPGLPRVESERKVTVTA